jgi:hypothetical protein
MHGSATALEETLHASSAETSHATETGTTTTVNTTTSISDALRRRAQSVINDISIDPRWRGIIRYALEIDDPWLADIVRRADAGEAIVDTIDFSLEPETLEDESLEDKVEPLTEIICRTGDDAAAALLVLMGTLENSTHPKLLANAAKHFAFTRCAESNLFGMVDSQIAVIEGELLAGNALIS